MGTEEVLSLVRGNIRALKPYSTARDEYKGSAEAFLDANENPYENGVNRYPSTSLKDSLRTRISSLRHIDAERIFMGNGSDEPIDLCFRVFCVPGRDNVVAIAPSYGMYGVSAAINDVEVREVVLNDDFSLPVERILAAADKRTKLLFLCSPNNPTGNAFPLESIRRIVQSFRGVVVLDEAYADFSDKGSMLPELDSYPNLIVLQTLSKAWGMAGLRVGLAFASKEIIGIFRQVKYPYNMNVTGIRRAVELLENDCAKHVAEIVAQRARVAEAISDARCVLDVYPSDANFLLVKVTDARGLYDLLLKNGVIVRDRSGVVGCSGCLRITIGTPEENTRLIELVRQF